VYAIYTPGAGHLGHSYWSNYWGQMNLAKTAEETGGESYYIGFSGPPVAYAPYLDEMSKAFSRQYLVTFLAKPEKKAGMRAVKFSTEVPGAELVGPSMVYVPAGL
jgi:hypothetical protein